MRRPTVPQAEKVDDMKSVQYALAALAGLLVLASGGVALAANATEINAGATSALAILYDKTPATRDLGRRAVGILIFPKIVKAGFMIGAQGGEGVLKEHGRPVAYYRSRGGSYGFQAGVQTYSYVMFLMTPGAVAYLNKNSGLEVGVGPSIVIGDEGAGRNMTTTTTKKDIYAYIFGQTGLMAGAGLQGVKITQIQK
jgi:lipid-binding SYLF domain-containing protein